jgi:predicted aconitase with swiveling domain
MTWNALRTLIVLLCGCTLGLGQTNTNVLVIPRTAENNETPYGAGTLRDVGIRNQQVYGSIEFPQQRMLIQQLRFRPDAAFGSAFSTTIANIRVNLSTTQRNPSSLSSTFSENVGPDDVIVFEGPSSVSSQFAGPPSGPKAFDIVVPLSQPFLYDPGSGNLVIDIRNFSGSTASPVSGQTGPDSASRVIGSTAEATGTVDVGADAIQIVFSPGTNVSPQIVAQPQSRTAVAGSDVTFSVNAIGNPPLTYQWRKGVSVISGATNASLVLTNVQVNDAGNYSVIVSNATGIAISQAATLTVVPRADHDLSLDFAIAAGNPNGVWSYGWQGTLGGAFNLFTHSKFSYDPAGVPVEVWDKPDSVPAVQHNNSTTNVVVDGGEAIFLPETTWFYPGVQGQPENFGVIRFRVPMGRDGIYDLATTVRPVWDGPTQRDADFHVLRNGSELFGIALSGTNSATYTNRVGLAGGETIDFVIGRGADNSFIGTGLKIVATLDLLSLTPVAPTIVSQPTNQTVLAGGSASFAVTASGSLPLTYQWRKGVSVISGATNASLMLTNVQVNDAGNYWVVVSNDYGAAISEAATLTVVPRADHDLSLDFAIAAGNPNGVWSYGWQGTLGGAFNLFTHSKFSYDPAGVPVEVWDKPDSVPAVQHNNSTTNVVVDGGEAIFLPETTWFYPGVQGQPENFGVIRFRVPMGRDGIYDLATTVRPVWDGPTQRDADFHVLRNGSELFGIALSGTNSATYTNRVGLAGGETIDFVIGRGADNSFIGTGLKIVATLDLLSLTPVAPTIVSQPTNQTVLAGGSASFAVTASGSLPLTYQWWKDGTLIISATNASLAITNVQVSHVGSYSVVVSNVAGTATSQMATLTVFPAPEHAAVVPRTAENIETPYGGGTLRDAGIRNQQVYGSVEFPQQPMLIEELRFRPDARFGRAFTATLANIQINLSTTARNPGSLSSTFSQNVGADDRIVFQGSVSVSSQFIGPTNGPKAFDIIVPLSQPYLYDPAGGNLVIDIRNFSGSTASPVSGQTGPDSASRVIGSATAVTGTVDVGADAIQIVFSPGANLPPRILTQPRSQGGMEGSNVIFTVIAVGTAPLSYQWRFNGVPILGATGASLTITNVEMSDAGLYSVAVENNFGGEVSSNAVLSIVTRSGLVIPAGLQNREGAGGSGTLTEQVRLQEVYGGLQFPAGNLYITELRFRPSVDFGTGAFTTAVNNVQINLSTTAKQPNNLSLTFAENTGTNDTVVFSGALSLSSQFSGPAGGPKDFDISIPLQTPFLYNRAQGNLLLDLRTFSGAVFRYVHDIDSAVDQASRIIATTASATQAVTADNGADVIQIIYSRTNATARLVSIPSSFPGGFAFTFAAGGSGSYVIEASTNLVNWTVLTNVVDASGLVEIVDPQVNRQRFYRARSP